MPPLILSGIDAAESVLSELKPKIATLDPTLTIVQVGNDPASNSYVRKKLETCKSVGMRCTLRQLPADATFESLVGVIEDLNKDPDVSGFIVQIPLPPHLADNMPLVLQAIDPRKDADGFTAYNLGKTFLSQEFEHLPPATPAGIITLLEHYDIDIEGKHVVIIGRSNIVGKPLAVMLLNRSATVTICHSHTKDLAAHTRQADILVSAVGKPNTITKDMVKKGAVVIDVGVTREEEGLVGDVDFKTVSEIASAITPVPGGVGPMTVASLIRNCVRAAERKREQGFTFADHL